ncbi:hypothetical protein AHF37_02222 [Paragonimus kellicotti]|nr:hypothetical protein AHF37_02222 [Paragonimus kellicotti]
MVVHLQIAIRWGDEVGPQVSPPIILDYWRTSEIVDVFMTNTMNAPGNKGTLQLPHQIQNAKWLSLRSMELSGFIDHLPDIFPQV